MQGWEQKLTPFQDGCGNQTENNVNIFLIVKFFYWTFLFYCLKTHVSLMGVAAVGTKNYVIATSTEQNMLQHERFASDSDYFLYRLDCLVYHLNLYSPVLELYNVILTTVREARTALLSSHEHSFTCSFLVRLQSRCCVFWSAWKAFVCYFKGTFTVFLDHCFTIPEIAVLLGICRKRRPKKTKTHWSKTKTIWSKTKSHWSKMKTLWSKTFLSSGRDCSS